jgi:hypothetical protein
MAYRRKAGLAIVSPGEKVGGCVPQTRRLARLYPEAGTLLLRQNSQPQIACLPVGVPASLASWYPSRGWQTLPGERLVAHLLAHDGVDALGGTTGVTHRTAFSATPGTDDALNHRVS